MHFSNFKALSRARWNKKLFKLLVTSHSFKQWVSRTRTLINMSLPQKNRVWRYRVDYSDSGYEPILGSFKKKTHNEPSHCIQGLPERLVTSQGLFYRKVIGELRDSTDLNTRDDMRSVSVSLHLTIFNYTVLLSGLSRLPSFRERISSPCNMQLPTLHEVHELLTRWLRL
jgi:hypothetical protein